MTCKEAETGIRVEGHIDSPITDVVISKVTVEKAATPVEIHAQNEDSLYPSENPRSYSPLSCM